MVEQRVAQRRKTLRRIVFSKADGSIGSVGAGQHQSVGYRRCGTRDGCEQQVMDRRVGQHKPDQRAAGCDGVGERRVLAASQQHDRSGRTRKHRGFSVVDVCVAACDVQVPHQHRQRLGAPRFSGAQRNDRRLVVHSTGEVIPADALDRDHSACDQCLLGGRQRRIGSVDAAGAPGEPQRRPAVRASDRLGVESPIVRVVVFGGTAFTHGERRHGGGYPVIGQGTDDGEPGTAVGARNERVPVTAVVAVE